MMIGIEIETNFRKDTGWFFTFFANFNVFPFISYIFAEGPPKSLIYPLKSGISIIFFTSFKIDFFDLETTNFP